MPLDGLTPKDFFPEWPNGDLVPPPAFEDFPFDNDTQRQVWLNGLEYQRELVLDYRHYVARRKRQKVALDTRISTNTLSGLNSGTRFLDGKTWIALRPYIPSRNQEALQAAEDQVRRRALADARWAEKETHERILREARRLAMEELRRRGGR
jgi:hypothetical protein